MVRGTTSGRNLELAMENYLNDSDKYNRKYKDTKPKGKPVPVPDKPSEYDGFFRQYAGTPPPSLSRSRSRLYGERWIAEAIPRSGCGYGGSSDDRAAVLL